MEKQITGKEIRKDMEYLVKLLHKEWERSGKTKAQVTVSLSDAVEIEKRMAGVIQDKQNSISLLRNLKNRQLRLQVKNIHSTMNAIFFLFFQTCSLRILIRSIFHLAKEPCVCSRPFYR